LIGLQRAEGQLRLHEESGNRRYRELESLSFGRKIMEGRKISQELQPEYIK
jgi:hypothetical protein